uniref:Uncharacterized protein n=1 Tax=Salix viminalis TaxID=40686 RepID=A0A6N2K065_SALVM
MERPNLGRNELLKKGEGRKGKVFWKFYFPVTGLVRRSCCFPVFPECLNQQIFWRFTRDEREINRIQKLGTFWPVFCGLYLSETKGILALGFSHQYCKYDG